MLNINMSIDATEKEIVIGQRYGYSKSSSGYTYVVIGTATKAENGKVTLGNIVEKTYMYVSDGKTKPHNVINHKRQRSIAAVQVFPVN